jgi:thymidylate kinase
VPKPYIIAFIGTVGAGKSTQMNLLAPELKARGLRVKVTSLKTGHVFAYFLEVVLAKMLVGEEKDVSPIRVLIEDKTTLFKRLFKLWLSLDIISISIRFILTAYIPLKLRRIVLVEEYFPATITDYIYLAKVLDLPFKTISPAVRFMQRLLQLSGPMQTIFLDAPNVVLEKRWSQRSSLNEKTDYLQMQRTMLLSVSKLSSSSFLYVETTNKTIGKTHRLIVNHLKDIKQDDCVMKTSID